MTSPYIYAATQHANDYLQTPYYYHTPRIYTPFLPPSPRSLPGSPYRTTALPPAMPVTPHYIPFPSSGYDPDVNYVPWDTRQRRISWQGPHSADILHTSYQPFPGPYPRRHSFSAPSYHHRPLQPQFTPWSAPSYPSQSPQLFINPWINASSPRHDFLFDLAPTTFTPLRFLGHGQSAMLSANEMHEPAMYPPLTRLRIICDLIPNWPIDLEFRQPSSTTPYSPYSPNQLEFTYQQPSPSPITLADVLVAIHQAMHRRITHVDWAKLNRLGQRGVTKAYLRRCVSEYERAQGVKRVDFLLGRTRMVGLVRSGMEDGWEVMRLVLADR
jgi:hypothetical protein